MANRRCFQTLTRYLKSIKPLTPISQTLDTTSNHALRQTLNPKQIHRILHNNFNVYPRSAAFTRNFSTRHSDGEDDNEEDEGSEDEEEDDETESENESIALSAEDKEKDAAEIGYKVIGPLQQTDRVFQPYEPVFAVIQIGSHQFKVSNGDTIYVERLKYCDVNDKLVLNKVLMLGSKTQTIIGRPILPEAAVHAVVEEHVRFSKIVLLWLKFALDAKVIIFKKKRRKNYRRTKGHRQELTKLRITDIQGIEKPEITPLKTEKKEKLGKMAVEA
ncbi:hypothetical protein RD792_007859 [Penstemon davidsonii]|uniref:Large ribosomal subunit protein bL21m n=1 Tax=Penstemon davidsonii TaxID=160366 RepID=A0ABR0D8B0_9LAMI|nr:hypothetical protein RD792_007859 [Penstemon davidsonii]